MPAGKPFAFMMNATRSSTASSASDPGSSRGMFSLICLNMLLRLSSSHFAMNFGPASAGPRAPVKSARWHEPQVVVKAFSPRAAWASA